MFLMHLEAHLTRKALYRETREQNDADDADADADDDDADADDDADDDADGGNDGNDTADQRGLPPGRSFRIAPYTSAEQVTNPRSASASSRQVRRL